MGVDEVLTLEYLSRHLSTMLLQQVAPARMHLLTSNLIGYMHMAPPMCRRQASAVELILMQRRFADMQRKDAHPDSWPWQSCSMA